MIKSEILAPVGSFDSLYAAVRCGANAVYLGTKDLNARRNASNFELEQLKEIVEYCNLHSVKVFLTINTLVGDDELKTAIKIIKTACEVGVYGLIIQDLGVAKIAREIAPNMFLSASTQLSIHNPAGLEFLAKAGFSRAVLARELSLNEIKELAKNSPIELEIFVHGALCMSVSGQCYMSSVLGGRSGNRGLCAQPCRLPFSAKNGTGHDLSLKDLSIIEHLEHLQEIGIHSFKIEGRMKRPEYVAAAVTACKNTLQKTPNQIIDEQLKAVFSRSGFTQGYYNEKRSKEMFGTRQKQDVTSANDVLSSLSKLYEKEPQTLGVDFALDILDGEKVSLSASSCGKYSFCESETIPSPAIKKAISEDICVKQISKCGGTTFYVNSIDCSIDPDLSIPMSELNYLRRSVLEDLTNQLQKTKSVECTETELNFNNSQRGAVKPKFYARFENVRQIPNFVSGINLIFLPLDTSVSDFKKAIATGVEIGVELPRTMFGAEQARQKQLLEIKNLGINIACCTNMGNVELCKNLGFEIHLGVGTNIFNSKALEFAESIGVKSAMLSFELTLAQAKDIAGNIPRGLFAYGRLPLMLTRNCPISNAMTCAECKREQSLTDRMGIEFPVRCRGGSSEILNSRPVYLAERMNELYGLDFALLYFTTETPAECCEIINGYINKEKFKGDFTRGLYYRGVE